MILIIAMKIMKVVFPLPSYKSSVGAPGAVHMKSFLFRKFMSNIQRCFTGEGARGLDFISPR